MTCGIYAITNKISGKRYVGSSKDIENRWLDHAWYLRKGKHHADYLQRAWNKYGENSFKLVILCKCAFSRLLKMEQKFIDERSEYNSSKIAGRVEMTPETKHKLSVINMGKTRGPCSEETKEKIKLSNLGQKRSEETKAKLRIARRRRVITSETKAKTSASLLGRTMPDGFAEATRARMMGKQIALGRKQSDEEKQKHSEYKKKWWEEKNAEAS